MKNILAFLICVSVSTASFSQQVWSLSDCIDYAIANNLQIKRSQLQFEQGKIDLLQSKTNLLPTLNGYAERTYNYGRSLDYFTNTFVDENSIFDSYGLSSRVTLFAGLRNYNNIKSNQYSSLAAFQNVEREKVEITLEIASAYLAILYQNELLQVAKNQRSVTELQVNRTEKLVEAGSVARGDLLEIQAQLSSENLNVTNSQNELNLSILNLAQILDLDSTGGFIVLTPDSIDIDKIPTIPDVFTVFNDALNFLPHIKLYDYQLKSAEKDLLVQKGFRSPEIYLQGSLSTGYSSQLLRSDSTVFPYPDQFSALFSQQIKIGISVPILNRWEVNNSISRARINVEDSRLQLDQVKLELFKNIQQAQNDAVSAREKFQSATQAVNSYSESFKYTEQKYNVGIVNSVEYNISKNNFIKAESELLQAKYEYLFSVKILDYYRGIPITI